MAAIWADGGERHIFMLDMAFRPIHCQLMEKDCKTRRPLSGASLERIAIPTTQEAKT